MRAFFQNTNWLNSFLKCLTTLLTVICLKHDAVAQCPTNLDFEDGTFNGWTCYVGNTSASGSANLINLSPAPGPVANRHEMLSLNPGNGLDPYGGFPKNCPNGSGHSIKLGNNTGGGAAEGVSYTFTIPAGANEFSLIYNYAVVFQDPGHFTYQQPRLVIEITNVTDNSTINCSSFGFIAIGGLPGFFLSPNPGGSTPVWCKDWSANSINLDGMAGKTIRLFFKTGDCTFTAHFGYAYVDVNTECSSRFVGATFCPDDSAINVTAPYGYQNYNWYNSTFSQLLGTSQILNLSPPPLSGSSVAVELIPFNGYGCKDTLTATLLDTLTLQAIAGPDKLACDNTPVQLGSPPVTGLTYSWSPTAGLNDPNISNPVTTPAVTTEYILSVRNGGGGCLTRDTVLVNAGTVNNAIQLIGSTDFCEGTGQSPVLQVNPADSIQWFRDNVAIQRANQTQYNVTQTGDYYAMIFSFAGCSQPTAVKHINVYPSPTAAFTINNASQCFADHQFLYSNTSSISSGTMQYLWSLGDGSVETTQDVSHKYSQQGTYVITLNVSSAGGCTSTKTFTINLFPTATADFSVQPVCVNITLPLSNNTVNNTSSNLNFLWDFGNGETSTVRHPVYSYPNPGTYTVTLAVSSNQCPSSVDIKTLYIDIDAPVPGITHPAETAILNFSLPLHARHIGTQVTWSPPINLSNSYSYDPVFKSLSDQLYTIQFKTSTGCVTLDTLQVKTIKKIEIYVPTGFTPNGDLNNDYLRPILMGFKSVNYFRVYNRWGKLVFETDKEVPGWDGRYKGVGQDSDVFLWMIEAVDVDDQVHKKQGSSVLIR